MEKNIIECLSKLIQTRFYWLSCHVNRGIFIGALDRKLHCEICGYQIIDLFKDKHYIFSKEDYKPDFSYDWFMNIYHVNKYHDNRKAYLTFLRRVIILEAWTEIEETLTNNNILIKDMNLNSDELTAFEFLRQTRICLYHWRGLKKKDDNKPITWNNITIDNSKKPLKIKDIDVDLLLKTIIKALIKKVPDQKIVNQDLRMAIDIDIVQKIAKKRFNDYDKIMKLYFG